MKIKQQKQLNLPQLIEWAWENDVRNKGFESERTSRAYFDYDGYLSCTREMEPTDSFTVEVEEEITEDTWFPKLVSRTVSGNYLLWRQGSINDFKYLSLNDLEAFYIPNDDLTMTLIWRDGKLIKE